MRRKYSTAQVVAILSRHHDFTARAPDTKTKLPERCKHMCDGFMFEFLDVEGNWTTNNVSVIPDRDDWEIVKPKRKRVVVGKMTPVRGSLEWDVDASELDHSKPHKLVAVEQ